ncbi:MAG: hypothetical protein [Caudoviricetes sp.]|nr:MAG: hypothetical protein [Caudoviricetes sp.]
MSVGFDATPSTFLLKLVRSVNLLTGECGFGFSEEVFVDTLLSLISFSNHLCNVSADFISWIISYCPVSDFVNFIKSIFFIVLYSFVLCHFQTLMQYIPFSGNYIHIN